MGFRRRGNNGEMPLNQNSAAYQEILQNVPKTEQGRRSGGDASRMFSAVFL